MKIPLLTEITTIVKYKWLKRTKITVLNKLNFNIYGAKTMLPDFITDKSKIA